MLRKLTVKSANFTSQKFVHTVAIYELTRVYYHKHSPTFPYTFHMPRVSLSIYVPTRNTHCAEHLGR